MERYDAAINARNWKHLSGHHRFKSLEPFAGDLRDLAFELCKLFLHRQGVVAIGFILGQPIELRARRNAARPGGKDAIRRLVPCPESSAGISEAAQIKLRHIVMEFGQTHGGGDRTAILRKDKPR